MAGWGIKHRFSNKRYKELIDAWNPYMVVYIHYSTKHSTGTMKMSVKFFLEFNNRIIKLFKGCEILEITIRDDVNAVSHKIVFSLYDAWIYLLGENYRHE